MRCIHSHRSMQTHTSTTLVKNLRPPRSLWVLYQEIRTITTYFVIILPAGKTITFFGRFVPVLRVNSQESVGGLSFRGYRGDNDSLSPIETLFDSILCVHSSKLFLNSKVSIVILRLKNSIQLLSHYSKQRLMQFLQCKRNKARIFTPHRDRNCYGIQV